jgi:NADH:ubiquinone oxidoreductase subunit B-like Fe-S oxidoreductase
MSDGVWQRNETWVGSEIEDSFVMVNIETGKYVALNATASLVWEALAVSCAPSEIEAKLRSRYDIAEDACHASVAQLLEQMRTLQLAAPV